MPTRGLDAFQSGRQNDKDATLLCKQGLMPAEPCFPDYGFPNKVLQQLG